MTKRSPGARPLQATPAAEPEPRAAGYWWILVEGREWEPAEWTGTQWWGIAMQRAFDAEEVTQVGPALVSPATQAAGPGQMMLVLHEPGMAPRIGYPTGDEVQSVRRWQASTKPAAALYVVQSSAPLPSPGTAWVDTAEEFLARDAALSEGVRGGRIMSRTKKGGKAPGFEYWSPRPGNKAGGLLSPHGGKHTKQRTHKAERQLNKPKPEDLA